VVTTAEESLPAARATDPPKLTGWARFKPGTRELIAIGIVAAALLIPFRGLFRLQGAPMEEGFMLVFPERFLHGDIPNRDFVHLYGPGSIWVLAAIYKVFGINLEVERVVGFLQQAGIIFGVYGIARWWGRRIAVISALLAAVIMLPPTGLVALAWPGAVAFSLIGAALGLHARATSDARRARTLAIVSGILFGLAFLYRVDIVFAVGLTILVLVWRAPRSRVVPLVSSAIATASLVVIHLAMAGPGTAIRGMVLDPVFKLRGGRGLRVPPSWGHYDGFLQDLLDFRPLPWPLPVIPGPQQIFFWFFLCLGSVGLLVGTGIWAVRRRPESIRARAVLVAGAFSLGILGQGVQRADSTHLAWISCVSLGLVPIALAEILRHRTGTGWWTRHATLVACAVPMILVFFVTTNYTIRPYGDAVVQTFGIRRATWDIEHGDRHFYYGSKSVADAANELIPAVDAIKRPGDRLFTGPADLRRTFGSEDWLYHLFPELPPGTRYIELDPNLANAKGSGLAHDLKSSDIVILSKIWEQWNEPNDSSNPGSPAASRVLKRDFCLVGEFGNTFLLYTKCNR